ncbi:MAG: alpha/beta fold hydrolase [Propionibacteriaceae bacterium]
MLTSLLGGRLMAEKYGDEAQIVAMHGWGRNRHDFAPVLNGYNALSLDLPGFGATTVPDEPWSTRDYADTLAEAVADTEPLIVMGHSFGGRVAVQFAAAYPERVKALVLTGVPLLRAELGNGKKAKAPLLLRMAKRLHALKIVPDSTVDKLRERYGSADYKAAQGTLRTILVKAVNEDYTAQLEAIKAAGIPVSLVWGAHDDAAPLAMAQHVCELLGPQSSIDVCASSSHLLDTDLVEALRGALDARL